MTNRYIGIIGGGTMGVGIAHRSLANGFEVGLVDVDLESAQRSAGRVVDSLRIAEERGKLDDAAAAAARLSALAGISDIPASADAIIEAVIENPEVKKALLAEAEHRNPVVLASNTSSISIDSLAEELKRPDRFAGMHFFNPVWAIDLVEVIKGSATSAETLDRVADIVTALGMQQATINDAPGFATSRLGVLVGLEAIRMVEEGVATAEDIDRAMSLGYRHPMGPLMLGDLVGLDVRLGIAKHLASVYGDRFTPPPLLIEMVHQGRLGKKSGRGFYDWSTGSAVPIEER